MKVVNNGGGCPCLFGICSPRNAREGRVAKLVYGIVMALLAGLILATGILIAGVGAAVALGAGGALITLSIVGVALWSCLRNKRVAASQKASFSSSPSFFKPTLPTSKSTSSSYREKLGGYYYIDRDGTRISIDLSGCKMSPEALQKLKETIVRENQRQELKRFLSRSR